MYDLQQRFLLHNFYKDLHNSHFIVLVFTLLVEIKHCFCTNNTSFLFNKGAMCICKNQIVLNLMKGKNLKDQ